ncbi:MAG: hypothetical protein J0L93_09570 [Deltaproteobacteria bacterium]|nr:hypothetical protein [Deltaproteobacteria bacterium]
MSEPKNKFEKNFIERICFFIFILNCISLPFFLSLPAFCQESGPTKVDPSRHIEAPSPIGNISVGVSDPNGIKQERKDGLTDLELGLIYKFRSKELIPNLMTPSFEAQPVVFSRAEKQNNQTDPNAAYGAGFKISANVENTSLKWFLRLAAVSPRNDSPVSQDTVASFEAMFGVSIPLAVHLNPDRLQRLRRSEFPIDMKVPAILFEKQDSLSADQKKVIHSVYMSAFFGMMKHIERSRLPHESLMNETVAEDLVAFMKTPLFNPTLSYSDEDILLGRVAATEADKQAVLVKYLKPFLTDRLRNDYRLIIYSEGGEQQIILQIFPTYLSKKEANTNLFNSEQMIDDFLSTTTEHLSYRLSDSQPDLRNQ